MCKFVQIYFNGINWNDYTPQQKRGRLICKETYEKEPDVDMLNSSSAVRTRWISKECPIFTQDMEFLYKLIPEIP